MKKVSVFEAAILKGLVETGNPTVFFGSLMGFSVYEKNAIKAKLVTKSLKGALSPTVLGADFYVKWKLSSLPDNRATSWKVKEFWLDEEEQRMAVWKSIKYKKFSPAEDDVECAARHLWQGKKAVLISDSCDNAQDLEAAVKDTLTNIRLLCHVLDLDFAELSDGSYAHYLDEKADLE